MDQGGGGDPTPEELSDLYAHPLGEFVAARNELAARLNREKRREAGLAVRRLSRPSPALWAVNRLSVEAAGEVAALLDAADRLRRAQSRLIGGDRGAADALRELGVEQGRLLARLRAGAGRILREAGHAASEDTLRRVESALRSAALADAGARRALAEGRLTTELEPPGFVDAPIFSVLPGGGTEEDTVPEGSAEGRTPTRGPAAEERERRAEEARRRLRVAERELAVRETAAERARKGAERAAERTRDLEALLTAARHDDAEAARRLRLAEDDVAAARRVVEEARRSAPD